MSLYGSVSNQILPQAELFEAGPVSAERKKYDSFLPPKILLSLIKKKTQPIIQPPKPKLRLDYTSFSTE